jgi:hypothetical protein
MAHIQGRRACWRLPHSVRPPRVMTSTHWFTY